MAKTMRRKTPAGLLSDVTFHKALELAQRGGIERCTLSDDVCRLHVPSSDGSREYIVALSHGNASCNCPAIGLCPHLMAAVFKPALDAIAQLRFAQIQEDVDIIIEMYAPAVRLMPEAIRRLVRAEWHHAEEMIRRSGSLAQQQAVQQAA